MAIADIEPVLAHLSGGVDASRPEQGVEPRGASIVAAAEHQEDNETDTEE